MSDDLEAADIWGDSNDSNNNNEDDNKASKTNANASSAASNNNSNSNSNEETKEAEPEEPDEIDDDTRSMSNTDLRQRIRLLDNDIRVMKSDVQRIAHESRAQKERIRENVEKVKMNKQLPYLVGNVVEILEPEAEDGLEEEDEEEGGAKDVDANRKTRSAVIRTSTRQTIYLPIPGLVDTAELRPSDLIGTNKDSYLILEKLPAEFDSRVKAMEVDERPSEEYSDIGGCDKHSGTHRGCGSPHDP
jgi:26S proteasome regulatory subunit T5